MDEEASQESVSHNNVQDTCTSSDSEEQEMSVPKDDDPLVKSIPEPEKCYTVASAVELETEKNEGDSIVAAVADTNCAAEDEPDSHEVETEAEIKKKKKKKRGIILYLCWSPEFLAYDRFQIFLNERIYKF